MPHSHNDPGWLKTVEGYFATATKNILNNIVNKLTLHTNMTFIWSEVGTTNADTGDDLSFSPSCAIVIRHQLLVRDLIFIFVKYRRQVEVFLRSFVFFDSFLPTVW
jgi:hypothetical protein